VQLTDFIRAVKATDPDFQRPGGDYESGYIRDSASGEFLSGFESWDRVEGVLLRALLLGPAWWLGVVELGSEEKDGPRDVLRAVLASKTDPASEPSLAVIHPTLTVTMPAQRRFERFQLARVADLVSVGDAFVYRLTPASLARARQQHIDLERVLSFLQGLNETPLPRAVRSSLTRWAERGTEVWLKRTVLLRVSDEEVMGQITASPRTKRFIVDVVGPTTATVAEKDWESLLVALAELGFLTEEVSYDDRV
jgi:hypothetical protein